jgi:hypothetical protein
VSSTARSAQPLLDASFIRKLERGWKPQLVAERTVRAIAHVARFLPDFAGARPAGKPLYGAQQIPGTDPVLRTADVSFESHRYARAEIVKASSALATAEAILDRLVDEGLIPSSRASGPLPVVSSLAIEDVAVLAGKLAGERGYPEAMARPR